MATSQPVSRLPPSLGPNPDGRPVWEPPILRYSDLIDEEYEKKREAAMKYTNRDAARATDIMNAYNEFELLGGYNGWLGEANGSTKGGSTSRGTFSLACVMRWETTPSRSGKRSRNRNLIAGGIN